MVSASVKSAIQTGPWRVNSRLDKWFLNKNPNFKISTNSDIIPKEWLSGLNDGMLSLSPSKHGCDGFFICCLTKVE